MTEALGWYAALLLLGAAGLIPAAALFRDLRSFGVLYARPLAMVLVAETAWLVAALSPIPYGTGLVLAATAGLWACSGLLAWHRPALLRSVVGRHRTLLAGEVLFAALFVLLALVRAQNPAAFGNEKPMEIMLLTAVHTAEGMPPTDSWFAGYSVSYYYLGYVAVDVTARVAGLGPSQAFNLGLATAGALAGVAAFAVGGDIVALGRPRRRLTHWIAGSVAVVSLLLLAPVQGLFELLWGSGIGSAAFWGRFGVEGFPDTRTITGLEPGQDWWWWHATRILPGTITEFPAFSLLLGDVHPHVLALPLGVLGVALAAATLGAEERPGLGYWIANPVSLLLAGALFAGLLMTNSWDVLPYGALWFASALLAAARTSRGALGTFVGATAHVAIPAMVALFLAVPFVSHLDTSAQNVGLVLLGSDPIRFTLVWVPLVLPLIVGVMLLRPRVPHGWVIFTLLLGLLLVAVWATVAVLSGYGVALVDRGSGWVVLAFLVAAASAAGAGSAHTSRAGDRAAAACLGLAAVACAIILATELVYVVGFHFDTRADTVFKFWYVVWMLFSVAGGAGIGLAFDRLTVIPSRRLILAATLCVPLYVGSLYYAPAVFLSRVQEPQQPSADAFAFYRHYDPELYEAVQWVNVNLGKDDVLLEAVGEGHSYANLVSAMTGTPTLLGWLRHELTWRGRIPEISQRWAITHAIYSEGATDQMREVARTYGLTHVYLGREESARYGAEVFDRFAAWPAAFETQHTRIVRVP